MNDLIQRIVNAIIRQEGMPDTFDNPGNLRGCPWLNPHSVFAQIQNGFWRPGARVVGLAGLAHLVGLHIAQGNSLQDFIAGHPGVYGGFCPGGDGANKPAIYAANVQEWAAIPAATAPLWTYIV